MAPTPRTVQTTCEKSRLPIAKIRFDTPAKMTCHAVVLSASRSLVCQSFEKTEPSAQLNDPAIRLRDHHNSRRPKVPADVSLGQRSMSMPTIPIANPDRPRREM